MPELPEVETYRRYVEATSLHQTIVRVEVEDEKLLTTDYGTLTQFLLNSQFTGTHRIGKQLFVTTSREKVLTMHFGMTGSLLYYRADEERPRFARIVFYFSNGYNLGFLCPRKFERIGLTDSVEAYRRKKKLGPDALAISLNELATPLANKKVFIKPLLLDQSVLAGIGNWIADEVLFQAKIHPETRANLLTKPAIKRLHEAIHLVLQTAIEREAVYREFPTTFLIHARAWDNSPYTDDGAHLHCPRCRTRIRQSRVGGRATYICSRCQKQRG